MKSYREILGAGIEMGILGGGEKAGNVPFVFSTIQTLSRDEILNSFSKDYFDYIVIDEVHRAGATTYQKIIEYFTPKFLMGMTATPERSDGIDIFKTFDHNVAYEIRLQQALEEKMLVPFHYYGVSEIYVNGNLVGDVTTFQNLICKERIERIIEFAKYYGCDEGRVKGLVFCSRVEEAKQLSIEFNARQYHTLSLDKDDNEIKREEAIRRLEKDAGEDALDYIFTVDIFNEGVDIPSVNQIIMLRPTQSAIIFVQQLGRGLRKKEGKEYLTVIDFIGNYTNNYMIPIALYGDRSYNKDIVRKLMNSGSSLVPGASSIHFDEIAKERIFKAIDTAKISTLKELKKSYKVMESQLGRMPTMIDFLLQGQREPYAFVKYAKSFYNFQHRISSDFILKFSLQKEKLLEFYSIQILNGKRVEEAILLALLIAKGKTNVTEVASITYKHFNYYANEEVINAAAHCLNGEFLKKEDRKKYAIAPNIKVLKEGNGFSYSLSKEFELLFMDDKFHNYVNDMIRYSFKRFQMDFNPMNFRGGFLLYRKYSRRDVCRILCWEENEESVINGYKVKFNTCPIFVNYKKKEGISSSIKYDDVFLNPHHFSWMTQNKKTLESKEVIALKAYKESGLRIPLFIRKNEDEGNESYYMGDLEPANFSQTTIEGVNGKRLPIVNIIFNMQDEVEESIYEYLEG